MDKLFGHMADVVIHYADDLMIATKGTYEEHLKVIELVLQQLALSLIHISRCRRRG